ncbi:MAG: polyprenyl synthetase family protein [Planctomycetota bacterium]
MTSRSDVEPADPAGGGGPGLPKALAEHVDAVRAELTRRFAGRGVRGISEWLEYQLETGGKRIRPAVALWLGTAVAPDDREIADRVLPFALAVELLHNVFLVHDDIEDGDTFRRGKPTLWAAAGLEDALNVSDYMLAEAYRLVAAVHGSPATRVELLEIFADTHRITVEGQALDLDCRADPGLTLSLYEEIISRKTGRYLALGWVGAAMIAGVPLADASALWEVGAHLGPAFQIRDDLLDLTRGKGRGGEIGCDIREGKPSFLVAFTLESPSTDSESRDRLLEILARPRAQTGSDDVRWVIELFDRVGAIRAAEQAAARRTFLGIERFEAIPWIPSRGAQTFRMIAEYLSNRNV